MSENAISFFRIVGNLKTIKRTGWVNNGIVLPESIADHMYRLSMLVLMIKDSTINKDRLQKICLVHDLAEAIAGDITPHDERVPKKHLLEMDGMKRIMALVNGNNTEVNTGLVSEILSLWSEYEGLVVPNGDYLSLLSMTDAEYDALCTNKVYTAESSIAHQLDKFEMILQADEYEQKEEDSRNIPNFLQSFFDSTCYTNGKYDVNKGIFRHSELIDWTNTLVNQRNQRIDAFHTK